MESTLGNRKHRPGACLAARESRLQQGDVVVTRERTSPVTYSVRQTPGAVQLRLASRGEAVRLARSFAIGKGVDLWYCSGSRYSLVERHRDYQDERR